MPVILDNAAETGRPSYSQTDDLNEQTVFTSAHQTPRWAAPSLDLSNLTQNSTIRLYKRVDGTNYVLEKGSVTAFTVASDPDVVSFPAFFTTERYRVTIQAGGAEGAARAIPYNLGEHVVA